MASTMRAGERATREIAYETFVALYIFLVLFLIAAPIAGLACIFLGKIIFAISIFASWTVIALLAFMAAIWGRS